MTEKITEILEKETEKGTFSAAALYHTLSILKYLKLREREEDSFSR